MDNFLKLSFPISLFMLSRISSDSFLCRLSGAAGTLVDVAVMPIRSIFAVIAGGEAAGRWLVISIFRLLYAFIGITIICFAICALSRVVFHPLF